MSAGVLREAARLMRERAKAATEGCFGWHVTDELAGGDEIWANRDGAGWDAFMVATTATRLNRDPGVKGQADATHIASWHPGVALAVADLLDRTADLLPPDPHGDDEGCCCCIHARDAIALARVYLGETS